MEKKEILIELIEHLFNYDEKRNSKEEFNMLGFLNYLNNQYKIKELGIRDIQGEKEKWLKDESNKTDSDISILVSLMYRYAKGYIRKALKDAVIKSADEFSILITLMTYESLTKTELITKVIMEKTSGTEIINRLINLKLIEQFEDINNKRNVRIKVTDLGKIEIINILPQMKIVSIIVSGNLTDSEKSVLVYLLKKLDFFHNEIFMNKRNLDLNEIVMVTPKV